MIGIIKCNGNISVSHGLTHLRARENNILHRRSAKLLGALLPENPSYRIGNITLSRTVRSDNSRYTVMKFEINLVCKGFKPLHLNVF